jgi:hypothetical protein
MDRLGKNNKVGAINSPAGANGPHGGFGARRMSEQAHTASLLEPFVNPSTTYKVRGCLTTDMGLSDELRAISCMFLKLIGVSVVSQHKKESQFLTRERMPKERFIWAVQKVCEVLQSALRKHEGVMEGVLNDDKGCEFLAFFGAPPYRYAWLQVPWNLTGKIEPALVADQSTEYLSRNV